MKAYAILINQNNDHTLLFSQTLIEIIKKERRRCCVGRLQPN